MTAIAGTAVLVGLLSNTHWDYATDAGPPIDALIHGRLGDFFAARPAMGPFSLIFRAPFAAISLITGGGGPGDDYLWAYRFGVMPVIVAAGLVGLLLVREMERRGRPWQQRLVLAALFTINPVALRAVHFGHPEEILGGTLVVVAVLAALRERTVLVGVLLGLALATKQWALLAVVPTALALGWARLRKPLAVIGGLATLVLVPMVAAGAGTLIKTNTTLLFDIRNQFVLPASIWWPFTHDLAASTDTGKNQIPEWLGLAAHPLILVVGVALPLILARRVRQAPAERIFPLLALIFLLRCMLDPVDSSWYHVPFFMSLVAADALSGKVMPTLAATFFLQLMLVLRTSPAALCAVYLAWTIPFVVYLFLRASGNRLEAPALAVRALDH
jgi:hypothetical protein